MRLYEIQIVDSLDHNDDLVLDCLSKASVVAQFEDEDILSYRVDNQTMYFLGHEPKAHLVTQDNDSYLWCLELRSYEPGKGYGGKLMTWVVKNKHKLFIDRDLTVSSANMIEKLISSGKVNASVVDIEQGTIKAYDGSNIPMYTQPINGRPTLDDKDAMRWTWLLETRQRRSGLLQEYVRYGPKNGPHKPDT